MGPSIVAVTAGLYIGQGHSSSGEGSPRASEPPKFNFYLPTEMTQCLQVFQKTSLKYPYPPASELDEYTDSNTHPNTKEMRHDLQLSLRSL